MSEPHLEPGTTVADRYEVEVLLGTGGLAEVYRVRHVELGSVHALKLLTWRRKSLADRLLLEGRIQAQLRHPHVVAVTDVLRFDGQVGLLMEYVDGTSLDILLGSTGALAWQDAMALFVPILGGVAAAHDAGVLHRDLKPANVLLARTTAGWIPKVADFGIAKVVADEMGGGATAAGVSMGTPGYMAPEQIRDSATVDGRTDLFALASILYEMLSGRKAFADALGRLDVASTMEVVPTPLAEVVPSVGHPMSVAIARALSQDRDDRFADVRAFAAALGIEVPHAASAERGGPWLSLDPRSFPPPAGGPRPGPSRGPTLEPHPHEPRAEATLFDSSTTPPAPVRKPRRAGLVFGATAVAGVTLLLGVGVARMLLPTGPAPPEEPMARVADPTPSEAAPASAAVGITPAPPVAPPAVSETPARPERAPVAPPPIPPVVEPEPPVASLAGPPPAAPVDTVALLETELATVPDAGSGPDPGSVPAIGRPPSVEVMARVGGRWSGSADGRPFELRILSANDLAVEAEAVVFTGTSSRRVLLVGTFDLATGLLSLQSRDRNVSFTGRLTSAGIAGSYAMGSRKSLPWSVRR